MGRLLLAIISLMIVGYGSAAVYAVDSDPKSTNYKVIQGEFGNSSKQQTCSGSFCSKTGVGSAGGSANDSEPLLEVAVEPGPSDLGTLTAEHTATTLMSVSVRTHLSDGYTVQVVGDSPTYGGHKLKTLDTPTGSLAGAEQFGLNVVQNTSPAIGANPTDVTSGLTNLASVTADYKIPDAFMYRSGDVVARNDSASGQMKYTISMIVNIANSTPAGQYFGDFGIVVTPRY